MCAVERDSLGPRDLVIKTSAWDYEVMGSNPQNIFACDMQLVDDRKEAWNCSADILIDVFIKLDPISLISF